MFLENYIIDVIEGKSSAPFFKLFLKSCSVLYRWIITLRHLAYDNNWIKSFRPKVPVVSIGNIVSGGVGKTPLVKKLAQELAKEKKVAILTRGFRSQVEKTGEYLHWKGEGANICGDEPFWLASQLPMVSVWIGSKRKNTAQLAVEQGAELLLLDDGMQHRKLARDTDIVVMDIEDLWGKGAFLPCGYLRDLPARLKMARLIVLTQVQNPCDVEKARVELETFTKAPLVGMRMRVKNDLKGKKVGLFCAIARPDRFVHTVLECGAEVIAEMKGLDHFSFSAKQLEDFAKKCEQQGGELLVCTEKDLVKVASHLRLCLPLISLPAELEIISGESHWSDLIAELVLR